MTADSAVMANHHQVVDLGPLAKHRWSVGAAIDSSVGPDLRVIVDLDISELS